METVDARRALGVQEFVESRRAWIQEIPEHVHVDAAPHGRDLDAREDVDPARRRQRHRLRNGRHGVVIGHAERAETGGRRTREELPWATVAVRCGRVDV